MKKNIVAFIVFLIIFASIPAKGFSAGAADQDNNLDSNIETGQEFQVIPDEAIRLRILANSDSDDDQTLKRQVRDEVNKEITKWVKEIDNIEEARQIIEERISDVEVIVGEVLKEKGIDQSYQVEYGKNIKFPTKVYDTYVYPAGEYEAILITLGDGKGANWWCVLFPPLCFLDFSNGTTVADDDKQEGQEANETKEVANQADDEKEVKFKFFFMKWFS
ncbi:stage II sporulation protein R [Aquibacillus salsiterrae]|uniref:Stage II sporulation protein R n=1 Tax=Aquibacillus salsiterrae TaxID=2950439 RepID=A0A9X3WFZ8_9BACI|nr:stage II sporulation protein R [Aquibacillus salsiterrae]MDC3416749.1 stage II sporulation protein R [Aquibacillus salsiterrae]